MRNREIFMGFLLLIFTFCLLFIANNYDKKMALKKQEELAQTVIEKTEEVSSVNITADYYDAKRIIIIGDSRMYAASKIIEDENIIFVAKNGATCSYLLDTAIGEVDKLLEQNPEEHFSIFINLGVNDLNRIARDIAPDGKQICNAEQYAKYYLELREKWNKHNLFFVSVNPIDEELAKKKNKNYSSNKAIKEFNDYISSEVNTKSIYYCNSYEILVSDGYETSDALHYSEDTTKTIIDIVKECENYQKEKSVFKMFLIFNKY